MPHPQEAILKEPAEATQSPRTRNTHAAHFQIAPANNICETAKLRTWEPYKQRLNHLRRSGRAGSSITNSDLGNERGGGPGIDKVNNHGE